MRGYTDTLLYLLHKEDIEAAYIEGTTTGGRTLGNHTWNLVNIDGANTLVDNTWGDSEYGEKDDGVEYYHLCVTSEELGRNHTPNKDFTSPTCTSHAYYYFQLNNCYFSNYNQSSYLAAKSAIENRSLLSDIANSLGREGNSLHNEQDTCYTVYLGWNIG